MEEKLLFKGKLLKLYRQKVRLPNGYLAALEVIKHPGAALIIPLVSNDKIILLRQLRPVIESYIYELPAGTLGKNESPLECARREIIEETGHSAKRFKRLGIIFPVPGYSTEKIVIFKAQGLKKEKIKSEADEIISASVLSKARVKSLFRNKKIVDAKTICALAMIGWL